MAVTSDDIKLIATALATANGHPEPAVYAEAAVAAAVALAAPAAPAAE